VEQRVKAEWKVIRPVRIKIDLMRSRRSSDEHGMEAPCSGLYLEFGIIGLVTLNPPMHHSQVDRSNRLTLALHRFLDQGSADLPLYPSCRGNK